MQTKKMLLPKVIGLYSTSANKALISHGVSVRCCPCPFSFPVVMAWWMQLCGDQRSSKTAGAGDWCFPLGHQR